LNFAWPEDADESFVSLKVQMRGFYYTLSVNGARVGPTIRIPQISEVKASAALRTSGPASYQTLYVSSERRLLLTLVGCLTPVELANKIASILGILPSQIVDIVAPACGNTTKRQTEVVSFTIVGDTLASADSLATNLGNMVSAGDPVLAQNGLQASNLVNAPAQAAPVGAVEFVAVLPVAAALSAGAIAGAVIGSIVGAAAIGGGVVAGVKYREKIMEKFRKNPAPADVEVTMEKPQQVPKKKPKGATVDLYNFDPDTITSITARAPPRKKA